MTKVNIIAVVLCLMVTHTVFAQVLSVGTRTHLGKYLDIPTKFPEGKSIDNVVALAITPERDLDEKRYFVFYDDRTVSVGSSTDFTSIYNSVTYYPARGRKVSDIVAIAFTQNEYESVTWYKDNTYSVGNHYDLDASIVSTFSLPFGHADYSIENIVGMGIHPVNGKVYTWFKNGHMSIGTHNDLDAYKKPLPYVIEQGYGHIVGMDFYSSDGSVAALHKTEPQYRISYTVGEDDGLDSGYFGIQHMTLPFGFQPHQVLAMAIEAHKNKDIIYTWYNDGRFTKGDYTDLGRFGVYEYALESPHQAKDIIDIGITSYGRTYTYLTSGYVVIGVPEDLTELYDSQQFTPLADRPILSIVGIDIEPYYAEGEMAGITAWYGDNGGDTPGQRSVGHYSDLDSLEGPFDVFVPATKRTEEILGIGFPYSTARETITFYKLY